MRIPPGLERFLASLGLHPARLKWKYYAWRRSRAAAQAAAVRRKDAIVAFFASLEGRPAAEVAARLAERLPAGCELPPVARCFHAGDGTLLELTDHWFELRASGTDAVLRYYLEGRDRARVSALNEAFTRLRVDA